MKQLIFLILFAVFACNSKANGDTVISGKHRIAISAGPIFHSQKTSSLHHKIKGETGPGFFADLAYSRVFRKGLDAFQAGVSISNFSFGYSNEFILNNESHNSSSFMTGSRSGYLKVYADYLLQFVKIRSVSFSIFGGPSVIRQNSIGFWRGSTTLAIDSTDLYVNKFRERDSVHKTRRYNPGLQSGILVVWRNTGSMEFFVAATYNYYPREMNRLYVRTYINEVPYDQATISSTGSGISLKAGMFLKFRSRR